MPFISVKKNSKEFINILPRKRKKTRKRRKKIKDSIKWKRKKNTKDKMNSQESKSFKLMLCLNTKFLRSSMAVYMDPSAGRRIKDGLKG